MSESARGILYLIPSPLGDTPPLEVLPLSVKKKVEEFSVEYWNIKRAALGMTLLPTNNEN